MLDNRFTVCLRFGIRFAVARDVVCCGGLTSYNGSPWPSFCTMSHLKLVSSLKHCAFCITHTQKKETPLDIERLKSWYDLCDFLSGHVPPLLHSCPFLLLLFYFIFFHLKNTTSIFFRIYYEFGAVRRVSLVSTRVSSPFFFASSSFFLSFLFYLFRYF